VIDPPPATARTARAASIIDAAKRVLEAEGADALTMRRLGDELGITAPSIYKHFADKAGVEAALVEHAFLELGAALHRAVDRPGRRGPVAAVLATYRERAVANPNLYRLATGGPLDREAIAPGIEDWAGSPFFFVTGEPYRAQALWAFAHGMVILEIDNRFLDVSHLDRTWRAGALAFAVTPRDTTVAATRTTAATTR
jgi:AcrR family transcriptional regulator